MEKESLNFKLFNNIACSNLSFTSFFYQNNLKYDDIKTTNC